MERNKWVQHEVPSSFNGSLLCIGQEKLMFALNNWNFRLGVGFVNYVGA